MTMQDSTGADSAPAAVNTSPDATPTTDVSTASDQGAADQAPAGAPSDTSASDATPLPEAAAPDILAAPADDARLSAIEDTVASLQTGVDAILAALKAQQAAPPASAPDQATPAVTPTASAPAATPAPDQAAPTQAEAAPVQGTVIVNVFGAHRCPNCGAPVTVNDPGYPLGGEYDARCPKCGTYFTPSPETQAE